jgi:hypothetical protein
MMSTTPVVSKKALWAGRVISALPVLLMTMSGTMKLMKPEPVVESFAHIGWPVEYAVGLGILELSCVAVYLISRTSVLGAILMTGYLGGAIATHVRIGEMMIATQAGLGVLVWLGLYLREPRLRALIPLRSLQENSPTNHAQFG